MSGHIRSFTGILIKGFPIIKSPVIMLFMVINKNSLIIKSNSLIHAQYELSLFEQKILLNAISQLNSDNIDPEQEFEIKASNMRDIVSGSDYENLKAACKKLIRRVITIKPDKDGINEMEFHWVRVAKYKDKLGAIQFQFSDEVIPFILNLKQRFTKYSLRYVSRFTSSKSIRIYEFLMQWQSTGFSYILLDDFRERLQLGNKYSSVTDLQKRIIKPSIKDINTYSDLNVRYSVKKSGRNVIGFQFYFSFKNKSELAKLNKPKKKLELLTEKEIEPKIDRKKQLQGIENLKDILNKSNIMQKKEILIE